MSTKAILVETMLAYQAAGLCVLPACLAEKRPAISGGWKPYQKVLPGEAVVRAWFTAGHEACCIVCGAVSGNLETLDFDFGGELYDVWAAKVEAEAPGLLARLVIEGTPSGGWHVPYRCEVAVDGNLQLAKREIVCPGADPLVIAGKTLRPQERSDGTYHVVITLIETRGEGGIVLCAPTPGYVLRQGDFTNLPVLSVEERGILLSAAYELNEYVHPMVNGPPVATTARTMPTVSRCADAGLLPGTDFNQRGDIRPYLEKHGWVRVRGGPNEWWRRPEADKHHAATYNGVVFYNFSSNAKPFAAGMAYSKFAVYTLLEHGTGPDSFKSAAKALAELGYGDPLAKEDPDVNLTHILSHPTVAVDGTDDDAPPMPAGIDDPGLLPEHLLDVPGFIGDLAAYTYETAPYPNRVMAFAGALCMQSYLCARRVRDRMNNRGNIYLVALAHSGVGKDRPRDVNSDLAFFCGLMAGMGDSFASGEGIEDSMYVQQAMLFQADEIDAILGSISKSKEGRNEMIMQILLKMYSSAKSRYPLRKKAGQSQPLMVDQPSLTLYGTAVPQFFYKALSGRMLNNGLFARTLVLDSGPRSRGRIPPVIDMPQRLVDTACWWAQFNPGGVQAGNLASFHPDPLVVPDTDEADKRTQEIWALADDAYELAQQDGDDTKMAIWARALEKTRKLALLYACSENHREPRITLAAMDWAWAVVEHQTRKMLYMANVYVADSDFEGDCKRVIQCLEKSPKNTAYRSRVLDRLKCKSTELNEIVDTLIQRGCIERVTIATKTKPALAYRLVQ